MKKNPTLYALRRENLHALVSSGRTTIADINTRLGRDRRNTYLYSLLNAVKETKTGRPRTISEKLARRIEEVLLLERGYLDQEKPRLATVEQVNQAAPKVAAQPKTALVALDPFAEIPLYGGSSSSIAFSRAYLSRCLRGRALDKIRALNASSDEFKPLLTQGDLLFYDSSDSIPRPGVFVLRAPEDSSLIVRRLSRDLVGGLNLSADNLPGSIPFDPAKLKIEGRAVYALRGLEL